MKKKILALLIAGMMAMLACAAAAVAEEVSADPYEEIVAEFSGATAVEPYTIAVRPARVSGWASLRWAPSDSAPLIATYPARQELLVRRETPHWLLAENTATGDIGYIEKEYAADPGEYPEAKPVTVAVGDNGKNNLGVIDVNGAFSIQCALPDGFTVQTLQSAGDQMVAVVSSGNPDSPVLMLSVAFDEAYAAVDRMNDLEGEELSTLENTFIDADPTVEISYTETGLGTRLMMVQMSESGLDYTDFFSIYKGYFVECVLIPSAQAADRTLTEEQIRMCIDFLTEMDFVPAGADNDASLVAGLKFITDLTDYNAEDHTVLATVMHGVPIPAEQAEALKVGDRLTAGALLDAEITSLETEEDGSIRINDLYDLRKYGGEYHVCIDEIEYLEPYVILTLTVPDDLTVTDDIDRETGDPLEDPVTYTAEEFTALLEAGTDPGFSAANTWVTFGNSGEMLSVEREYSPVQ